MPCRAFRLALPTSPALPTPSGLPHAPWPHSSPMPSALPLWRLDAHSLFCLHCPPPPHCLPPALHVALPCESFWPHCSLLTSYSDMPRHLPAQTAAPPKAVSSVRQTVLLGTLLSVPGTGEALREIKRGRGSQVLEVLI